MTPKRLLIPLANLAIFLLAGLILYHIGHGAAAPENSETESAPPTDVPVHIGRITSMTLHRTLTAYGHIEPAPTAISEISVPLAARVNQVQVIEGQSVKAGQTLFSIDARDNQPAADIAAPFAGTITAIKIHPGDIANPRIPAMELVDTNQLVIALDVPASYLPQLKLADPVIIDSPVFPKGTSFDRPPMLGTVLKHIDPTADNTTGMVSVDALLSPEPEFIAGQFAAARIITDTHQNVLAVPAESILMDSLGRAQIAIVSDDQTTAVLHFVTTGVRENDWVEIQGDQISAGQTIVTQGAFGLLPRTHIHVVGN